MPDNAKRTGAAIEAHYQFLTWLAPAIENAEEQRHARACPGHPRLSRWPCKKDVDARDKRGHDGGEMIRSHRNKL